MNYFESLSAPRCHDVLLEINSHGQKETLGGSVKARSTQTQAETCNNKKCGHDDTGSHCASQCLVTVNQTENQDISDWRGVGYRETRSGSSSV
jgi:hypothetical protein